MMTVCTALPQTTRPIGQISTSELIDRLVEISNDEFAVRTNILPYGSAAGGLPQGLLRTNDPSPKPAEVMAEIVRRGAAAVPDLAAHLDDARKTKATVAAMFGGIWYSAEYDWNRHLVKHPAGVIQAGEHDLEGSIKIRKGPPGEYALAVGDFCFKLIGDIVNRDFDAAGYRPTAIVYVNSPILCPDLCTAVRNEWGKLTPAEHQSRLVADVTDPDQGGRDIGGMFVLQRYYPQAVAEAVKKRLTLPYFDADATRSFVQESLYMIENENDRDRQFNLFLERHGSAARDGLLLQLWDDRDRRAGVPLYQSNKGPGPSPKVAPATILKQLFPDVDPSVKPQVHSVEIWDNSQFIKATAELKSPPVDQAIWEYFQTCAASRSEHFELSDDLAISCIVALAHKGHDGDFMAYCVRRSNEISEPAERQGLKSAIEQLESDAPATQPK